MTKLEKGWAEAGGRALAEASKNGADVSLLRGARRPQPFRYPTSLTPKDVRIAQQKRLAKKGMARRRLAKKLDAVLGEGEE